MAAQRARVPQVPQAAPTPQAGAQTSPTYALSRRDLLRLGAGLAVAASFVLPAASSPTWAYADAAEPSGITGTLGLPTVCGVPFSLPQGWRIADAPDEVGADRVSIAIFDPFSQREVGLAVLAGGEAPAAEDGRALDADALFARLAQDCTPSDGAAWGMERHDIGGFVAAATCSFSALRQEELLVGRLYLAKIPTGGSVALAVLAQPPMADAALAQADAMWQAAGWETAVAAGLDEFKRAMLEEGIARNAEDPAYNPYWQVTDFACSLNTSNPDAPYPDHMRYQYGTPEGFTAWEDDLVPATAVSAWGAPAGPVSLWAMPRVDSDGAPYLRSTVEVSGVGVVDIAFYEGFSSAWYIAGTGEAVCPDAEGDWHRFNTGDAPWTPYAL